MFLVIAYLGFCQVKMVLTEGKP